MIKPERSGSHQQGIAILAFPSRNVAGVEFTLNPFGSHLLGFLLSATRCLGRGAREHSCGCALRLWPYVRLRLGRTN